MFLSFPAKYVAGAAAALFALLAAYAGFAERRSQNREHFDRVPLLDWRNTQAFALIITVVALWATVVL